MSGYWTNPTFEGWWKCHKCEREVDSSIWGHECPDCQHPKCEEECTDIDPPQSQAPIANDSANYRLNRHYPSEMPSIGSSSREAHRHSSSRHGHSKQHKLERQSKGKHESQQNTERQRTHNRGLRNETYYANSDPFYEYTKTPSGGMVKCCSCGDEINVVYGTCPGCSHVQCNGCTAANRR